MVPLRELGSAIATTPADAVRGRHLCVRFWWCVWSMCARACVYGVSGSGVCTALCLGTRTSTTHKARLPTLPPTPNTAPQVRPISGGDFAAAAAAIKPSVSREQLRRFESWTTNFGMAS